jgi:hypothetical protein
MMDRTVWPNIRSSDKPKRVLARRLGEEIYTVRKLSISLIGRLQYFIIYDEVKPRNMFSVIY